MLKSGLNSFELILSKLEWKLSMKMKMYEANFNFRKLENLMENCTNSLFEKIVRLFFDLCVGLRRIRFTLKTTELIRIENETLIANQMSTC